MSTAISDSGSPSEAPPESPPENISAPTGDLAAPGIPNDTYCSCPNNRNLVICIDGTSNQYSDKSTNVIELYSLLEKNETQLTYYNSGIGTYAKPSWRSLSYWKQVIDNKIDLAIAWNFERIIMGAYRWLSEKYKPGDRIYMFGFSRGAYQVRALAGMLHKVGLIHEGNQEQIPFAYELYADDNLDADNPKVTAFKETFSREVRVHLIGAWDTVSSIGFVKGKNLPHTADGLSHVCTFRHALALDERRVRFLPEYVHGGRGPDTTMGEKTIGPSADKSKPPHTKEVWFAGTHSDIGGGSVPNPKLNLSSAPLQWMVYEALSSGLRLKDTARVKKMPNWSEKDARVHESLTGMWWLLEFLPLTRLTYKPTDESSTWTRRLLKFGQKKESSDDNAESATTNRLHRGRRRRIQQGQKIHVSIKSTQPNDQFLDYYDELPKALLPKSTSWIEILRDDNKWRDWREDDLWTRATEIVEELKIYASLDAASRNDKVLDDLEQSLETADGRRAIGEVEKAGEYLIAVMNLILRNDPQDVKSLFIVALALSYVDAPAAKTLIPQNKLLGLLNRTPDHYRMHLRNWRRIIETLYDNQNIFLGTRTAYKGTISSVAFSPGGDRIISGSYDDTVRVWDTATGAPVLEPLTGHSDDVNSVAYSPDGRLIVSGSDDCTIRLWNAETGEPIGKPFKGHTNGVRSVAFSRDGKYIVSGSWDETIRVWNSQTGEPVSEPFKGHTFWVWSIAFSPDGTRIVSGSEDKTMRIWDSQTGECVLGPLEGHTSTVCSVAYSPDGWRIVSGSWDHTIRTWEAATGKLVSEFKGHTDYVRSVAYSPDGVRIASGSDDRTVRVWDTNTGATVLGPLKGHTDCVNSVAYSLDGTRIVSGGDDGAIRVWDARTGARVNPYERPDDTSKPEGSREEGKGKRAVAPVYAA